MNTNTGTETLITQTLRAAAESMRQMANLCEALAIANAGGNDADMLRPADVARLLRCSDSKGREIVRAHGTGSGKMGRIQRGILMQLQREGRL